MHASSPQGRFADGAAQIDGHVLRRTEAYGKHLLHHYTGGPLLHIHLGLYGKFTDRHGCTARPARRAAAAADGRRARGRTCAGRPPASCSPRRAARPARAARPGPAAARTPIRAGPSRACPGRRSSIAALLMDQRVVAGIGNVYRAELLFRHRLDPFLPGTLDVEQPWSELWADLVTLMRSGVRTGQIVTVRAEDRPRTRGGSPARSRCTSTGAPACRAGCAAPRSAPRSWSGATCSGARPASGPDRRRGPVQRRVISRTPAMISTAAVAAAIAGKP